VTSRLAWRIAVRESELDANAKAVALVLDTYMDGRGFAWPSRKTIAQSSSLHIDTVDRALRRIEKAGLLLVVRSPGRASNRYQATIPNSPVGAAVGDGDETLQQPHPAGVNSRTQRGSTAAPNGLEAVKKPSKKPKGVARTRAHATDISIVDGRANPQALVAYFVDTYRDLCDDPPPRRIVGQVAQQIGQLAREGFDEQTIEQALRLMLERRQNPSTLASFVLEAKAGPPRKRAPHVADRARRHVLERRKEQP
jgi:hypothetical protein